MTTPLTDVDGHADTLVTVILDGLDFATAHGYALAETFADLGFGRARAVFQRLLEHIAGDLAQLFVGMRKGGLGHGVSHLMEIFFDVRKRRENIAYETQQP